jgi:hypothetical protein
MKLSSLLANRNAIIRQAYLANAAHAYCTLDQLARRVDRACLSGRVKLRHANEEEERWHPLLLALQSNQSLIEEHFSDRDIVELADSIAFVDTEDRAEVEFRLEDLADWMVPLKSVLDEAGVEIDVNAADPYRLSDAS